jgi:hypothetical protein
MSFYKLGFCLEEKQFWFLSIFLYLIYLGSFVSLLFFAVNSVAALLNQYVF